MLCLQYFSTFGSMFEEGCVPWLPPSVISSDSPKKDQKRYNIKVSEMYCTHVEVNGAA